MFDQISLSGQNSPRSTTPPQDVTPESVEEHLPERTSSPEKSPTPEMEEEDEITSPVHEYPVVHIDTSEPQPVAVQVATEDIPTLPPPTDSSHLSVVPNGGTAGNDGPSPKAVSTPSLPIPPPTPSTPPRPSSSHRTTRSLGPSALEKVISKTRPSFLPPKSREEDNKHLADWEHMMKRSRAAGTFMSVWSSARCSGLTEHRGTETKVFAGSAISSRTQGRRITTPMGKRDLTRLASG